MKKKKPHHDFSLQDFLDAAEVSRDDPSPQAPGWRQRWRWWMDSNNDLEDTVAGVVGELWRQPRRMAAEPRSRKQQHRWKDYSVYAVAGGLAAIVYFLNTRNDES